MDQSWTKSIALFAGVVFFCVGIVLVYQVVRVGGVIDVQAAAVSGRIDKGIAGLIILSLATMIVISSLAFGTVDEQGQQKKISSFLWGITLFVISLGVLVSTAAKSFEGWGHVCDTCGGILRCRFRYNCSHTIFAGPVSKLRRAPQPLSTALSARQAINMNELRHRPKS